MSNSFVRFTIRLAIKPFFIIIFIFPIIIVSNKKLQRFKCFGQKAILSYNSKTDILATIHTESPN